MTEPTNYHGRTMQDLRDRIEQLEGVIGVDRSARSKLSDAFPDMEPSLGDILSMLLKRDFVTREGLYTVQYGARPESDQPDEKVLDVLVCRLRNHLEPHGVTFKTARDAGWFMPKPEKAKLRALIENAPLPDLEGIARREEQKRKRQAFLWNE